MVLLANPTDNDKGGPYQVNQVAIQPGEQAAARDKHQDGLGCTMPWTPSYSFKLPGHSQDHGKVVRVQLVQQLREHGGLQLGGNPGPVDLS